MTYLRLSLQKTITFVALAGMTQMQAVVAGTPVQPPFNNSRQFSFVPPPPPDNGAPGGRRKGGASRGNCPLVDQPLTALVPAAKRISGAEYVGGLTTVEHPTFWFYVPYKSALVGKLVIENEAEENVSQTLFKLSGKPGVIGISPQSTSASLEIGKRYHWYLLISCNSADLVDPVFVEGWVQRTALDPVFKNQLDKATPRERVALYAAKGIWHEAVTTLAPLRQADPKDVDWVNLLQSVGLQAIASEPIVDCCTLLQSKRAKQI